MVSSKDESATDNDKLSGEVSDSNSSLYSEGEKVLAYHGPCICEAKCPQPIVNNASTDLSYGRITTCHLSTSCLAIPLFLKSASPHEFSLFRLPMENAVNTLIFPVREGISLATNAVCVKKGPGQSLCICWSTWKVENDTLPAASLPAECSVIYLPFDRSTRAMDLFEKLNSSMLYLQWKVSEVCTKCHYDEGQCLTDTHNNFQCLQDAGKTKPYKRFLIITDDLILFGEASTEQAAEIKRCLELFCSASGQKVNPLKSSVFFSKNTDSDLQQLVSNALGIPRVMDMGKYLGMPSFHGRLSRDTFEGIIERMRAKLAGWKSKSLSFAGRQTLAQSVLSSIPYYSMQSSLLPIGVTVAIEKIVRDFLWGSKEGERKCHLVKWEVVTKSKAHGGLGIRKIEPMNRAFLAKLGWRLLHKEDCLWTRIFKSKYSFEPTDISTWRAKSNMSNAWRGILKSTPILLHGIKKTVRNGRGTFFWKDTWLGDKPLYHVASSLVSASELDKLVFDYWDPHEGWNWELLSQLLPEEVLSRLAAYILHDETTMNDILSWGFEASGAYSVSSGYDIALGTETSTSPAKWNSIWKLKVPNRIRTFVWLVKHDRILTNENRAKRGMTNSDKCWLCTMAVESVEHVLRSCPVAGTVWRSILPDFTRITRNLPFEAWLEEGVTNRGNGRQPADRNIMFALTLWWIWKWRNTAIFKKEEIPTHAKIHWIRTQFKEIRSAFAKAKLPGDQVGCSNWQKLSWNKPQSGYVKINVDAAVDLYNYRASCGGLIRDEKGDWIQGFAYTIGYCTPQEAEAWALLKGAQLAASLGLNRVIFESDSSETTNYMNSSKPPSIAAHNILDACKRELRSIESWNVAYIAREQNQVADSLAKLATGFPRGLTLLSNPPNVVLGLLEDDIAGLPTWRDVCNT